MPLFSRRSQPPAPVAVPARRRALLSVAGALTGVLVAGRATAQSRRPARVTCPVCQTPNDTPGESLVTALETQDFLPRRWPEFRVFRCGTCGNLYTER